MKRTSFFDSPKDENIVILDKVMQNDECQKYKIKCELTGEMIVEPVHEVKRRETKMSYETYDEYLNNISKIKLSNYLWIYNIIDGIAEQDAILFSNDQIIIIPTFTWNTIDFAKLHLLTIVKDKHLRSIRDLRREHIPLLKHAMIETQKVILATYGISTELLKMYFHYLPSTWHLHIHFCRVDNINVESSVEYSHELSSVIFNLELCSDYYKLCKMTVNG